MKKRGISPTQRTLRELKNRGMECGVVERFVSKIGKFGKRIDLFGFIDIIAMDEANECIWAIQSCGQSGHAEHRRTITEKCAKKAEKWLKCKNRIQLWSWSKKKLFRGSKAVRWGPRIEEILLSDLDHSQNTQDLPKT